MSVETPIEREAKFDVDRDFDPPDLRGVVGSTERLPDERLRTVYFDTPDQRLRDQGISLRHRTVERPGQTGGGGAGAAGGGQPGERGPDRGPDSGPDTKAGREREWTLKLPLPVESDFLSRDELSWPGEANSIAPEAVRILDGIVRRSRLQPVGELDTTRRRLLLRSSPGEEPWAEVDDDLVTVVGGPRDGTQFRQIELELIGSEPRKAASVIKSLRRSGAKPSSASKIGIALGEGQGKAERPRRRQRRHGRQRRRRHESITDTIRASVKGNLDQLLQHDYRLRISPELPDPHDVHQARVATRRLRSDLNTFAPYLDPVWLHHTREELRWIGTTLGEVRDIDVLSRTISDSGATSLRIYEGTAELVGLLSSGRAEPARELLKAMDSERYVDLLDRLHAAGETPPVHSRAGAQRTASKVLPSLVDTRWRSVRRAIRNAGINPGDEELHRIRIRAKRLRYAAEVASPVIGKRARKTGAAAESLQNTLGELRDSKAAEAWLKDMVAQSRLSADATFAAGVIARDQELRQERLRRQWKSDWKVVKRRRRRN